MVKSLDPRRLALFDARQRDIIAAVNEWGYLDAGVARDESLYRGRRMLDIGMGGGPYSVAFIVGGAASYIGVDPKIGTKSVRDLRSHSEPGRPRYAAFPFTAVEIMQAFPAIRLYPGLMEDYADELKSLEVNLITLSVVTEHLTHLDRVIAAAWAAASSDAALWLSHANYYSWTGHHRNPRALSKLDIGNPAHVANIDWRHLESDHPAYANDNLNRIRLNDFRTVIAKYFDIAQWQETYDAVERLTPELRQRWRRYSLSELLARTVHVYAFKRAMPLNTDFARLVLHHPPEDYRADADYSAEPDEHVRLSHRVFLAPRRMLGSHSYNNTAGARVMASMAVGEAFALRKRDRLLRLTVEAVSPTKDGASVRFAEDVCDLLVGDDPGGWTIERGQSPATPSE